MKDYMILINEESKPVLVEVPQMASISISYLEERPKDITEELYQLMVQNAISDKSKHIQFRGEDEFFLLRKVSNIWDDVPKLIQWAKENVGQIFPLPTGYKVSFEECEKPCSEVCMNLGYCGQRSAILSKLEELSGITTNENDSVVSINSFTTCPHSGLPCYDELCGKTTIICNNAHNFSLESKLNEVAELKRNLGLPVVAPSEEVKQKTYTKDEVEKLLIDQARYTAYSLSYSSAAFVYPRDFEKIYEWQMSVGIIKF